MLGVRRHPHIVTGVSIILQPRIVITRQWADEDIALLGFEVCDGSSVFRNTVYASLDWGAETSDRLRSFSRQVYGGLFNLDVGEGGPEYAGGAFHARFHYFKPTELLISTKQQGEFFQFKSTQVATRAEMYLRTEPALLDRFVAALPALDGSGPGEALLECVRIGVS